MQPLIWRGAHQVFSGKMILFPALLIVNRESERAGSADRVQIRMDIIELGLGRWEKVVEILSAIFP